MSRLDYRHFLVITTLILILYWLLLPKVPEVKSSTEKELMSVKIGKTTESREKAVESEMELLPIIEKDSQEKLQQKVKSLEEEITKLQDKEQQHKVEKENLKEAQQKAEEEIEKLKTIVDESEKKEKTNEGSMNKLDESIKTISQQSDELLKENEKLKEDLKTKKSSKETSEGDDHVKISQSLTSDFVGKPFTGLKLIHLDLKGAPPKLSYLLDFIKFSKQHQADGFLIEYEDMFPWSGDLKVLASEHAYTEDDIKQVLQLIKDEKLIAIPLIQTFGHLEFVLKHKEFRHLRANIEITNSISALNNDSVDFIKSLLNQILSLHPDCEWIHLGGDEVWNMNTCEGCLQSNLTDAQLFLHHMNPLFTYIKSLKTSEGAVRKPIIWDDMLRRWPVDELKKINSFVTPMVWAYVENLDNYHHFPADMWEHYSQSFNELWLASSFKGALKPWSNFVPIKQHLHNHLSWLKISSKLLEKDVKVLGIALTGWSRFDHYGPLCELLPAGIPSLTLCLTVLQKGKFNEAIHEEVSNKLGFKETFKIGTTNFKGYTPELPTFPGGNVYHLVGLVVKAIGWKDWSSVREIGWMRHSVSPDKMSFYALNVSINGMRKSISIFEDVKEETPNVLGQYFDTYVVEEWIKDKIDSYVLSAKKSINAMGEALKQITY